MALPKNIHDFDLKALNFESKITSKPEKKPKFTIIYGKGKIGKTTVASYSPDPIIIPVGRETGVEEMAVHKFPNYEEMGLIPIDHLFSCFKWIISAEHSRKTLIIDNTTSYREIVDEDVEKSNIGVDLKAFGKGSALAYPYWMLLLSSIDHVMKKRDMHVILLGHEGFYNENLPDGSYYQKISINAPRGENTNVVAALEARAHNVLRMTNEISTVKVKNNFGTVKQIASQGNISRSIYTQPKGNYFAGSRADLDDRYDICDSDNDKDLLHLRNNPDIIRLWNDIYRE